MRVNASLIFRRSNSQYLLAYRRTAKDQKISCTDNTPLLFLTGS